MPNSRPKHLNLLVIKFPVTAFVSGVHRLTGALLFLLLPLVLVLWQQSLATRDTFETFSALVSHPLMKLVLIVLLWAYLHHFCAGIRHLGLDLDIGTDLRPARASSYAVFAVSIVLTLVIGVALW